MAGKWPRFGGPWPSWQLAWTMNWVDWLRTSADKRMWSGQRAVVMVWWPAVGCGCSALISRSSWTGNWASGHEGYPPRDCSGQGEGQNFLASSWASRAVAGAPVVSDLLCVYSYVHFVCVCVYMCMCVCVRTCIYIYMCMCICICICMRLYTCSCVCVCVFVHRLWVSVSVLQRVDIVMDAHVRSCTYVCVSIWVWVHIHVHFFAVSVTCTLEQVFWTLVHGQVCTLHGCVFTPTYTSANTLAVGFAHMCIFIRLCIYMHMCMDACVRLWYCLTR